MENGELRNLQKIPVSKVGFPTVLWKKRNVLFTIGGFNKKRFKEVEEYSVLKNKWKMHSELPQALSYSSAVILHPTIYNIGGGGLTDLILLCDLSSSRQPKWNALNLKGIALQGLYSRMALIISNKIV